MPARYIMIGGFLGAGKTTAIGRFARYLDGHGMRVGLITNDQGAGLVDSALGRSGQFPVEEISGGCFCCRFNSLVDAARHLSADGAPDVFLAEPVGSCTDLVATVSLPLRKIYGDQFRVAPLSVLVDPVRARRVLGLEEGKRFSEHVRYIYLKQLEEAERIVINKLDLVDKAALAELRAALTERFPHARIVEISAREGQNLEAWFEDMLADEMAVDRLMDVDYERYGEGEALLGWLNCTVEIEHPAGDGFDGNLLLEALAGALRERMAAEGVEVAHLKATISPLGAPFEVAAVNLVRSDARPELSHRLIDPVDTAELLLNMRCEADPEWLDAVTDEVLESVITGRFGLRFRQTHREHFRPSPPQPTHRFAEVS